MITIWGNVNDYDCSSADFILPKTKRFQVSATKVIVEPWLSKHHVYGIFKIPDKYKETPFFILTIPGNHQYCSRPFGYDENYDDVFAEPGTHLIRYYIRSRTGIKLIFQGLYFQLNNPNNWILSFPLK
jgi:hypothetical protein